METRNKIISISTLLGKIKMNRFIDYQTTREHKRVIIGRPYNEVFVTILQPFGLTPEDYEQGQLGFGFYGSGAREDRASYYDHGTKRSPLPFVFG